MSSGRVLIVDDDAAFADTYADLLGADGYETVSVGTAQEAGVQASRGDWDVVLLDQKLQGAAGPDVGIDLIPTLQSAAPDAKIIVATAYALPHAIERAFALGAYDYLEKNTNLPTLLRVKVRNAVEATRELRLARASRQVIEHRLRESWSNTLDEADPQLKGARLEETISLLLRTIAGFQVTKTNRRTDDEEIDIYVRNASTDPFWQKESPYLLVECKHWSRPVDPKELAHLFEKIVARYGRCRLGIFVAIGGFTAGFESRLAAKREGDHLVIALDRDDVDRLVNAADRVAVLAEMHERASLGPGSA
jgi:CheY-like chemotaxis protein